MAYRNFHSKRVKKANMFEATKIVEKNQKKRSKILDFFCVHLACFALLKFAFDLRHLSNTIPAEKSVVDSRWISLKIKDDSISTKNGISGSLRVRKPTFNEN